MVLVYILKAYAKINVFNNQSDVTIIYSKSLFSKQVHYSLTTDLYQNQSDVTIGEIYILKASLYYNGFV